MNKEYNQILRKIGLFRLIKKQIKDYISVLNYHKEYLDKEDIKNLRKIINY